MVSEPGPVIDGVSYFTGISQSELIDLYQKAWLFVSPSKYEGFGLPCLEAMACGAPVIATSNPGSRELLGCSEFGLLASDKDIALKILDLLSNTSVRARMTALGIARASQYSLEKMLDQFEALMRKLCPN